jgi:selenocysteine-specific elongation factor
VFVIATAGHVDHGKSTLLRAITGMEPDRWDEERRREMTIDLGYVWTELPTGETVAFVDVPGHERFVPNMLAGVGPVPAVLFAVAADGGWEAQSEEHLRAIDAFGIHHGVLVVTRSDLAEPAPALDAARARIAKSSLGHIEALNVSARTGAGMAELLNAISRLVRSLPPPDLDADVRLWIDRAFTIAGAGTVVTGTLGAGMISRGDVLEVHPAARRVRVRAIETIKHPVDTARAVTRVALNLRDVDRDELRRGDAIVAPGRWRDTTVCDVRLVFADLPEAGPHYSRGPVKHGTLHIGTASVTVDIRPLGAHTARIHLARPLPLRIGDTALVRDLGMRSRYIRVVVLDPYPPALFRRGAASARARIVETMKGEPDPTDEVLRRGALQPDELTLLGASGKPAGVIEAEGWYIAPERWTQWSAWLTRLAIERSEREPLDPGVPFGDAARRMGLPDARLIPPLVASSAELSAHHGRIFLGEAEPALPSHLADAIEVIHRELEEAPFSAPYMARLADMGIGEIELRMICRRGLLLEISPGIVLLPEADLQAASLLRMLPQPFTVAEARNALGSSRRVTVPLLEYLDRHMLTRRIDNVHRITLPTAADQPAGQAHL